VFSSVEEVSKRLRSTGYIADSVAVTTVYLAASLQKPVLLEGPAGSGKTQLAYALQPPQTRQWNACSATRESMKKRPLVSSTDLCRDFASS
jgi:replication-associated recombination protein RarA